MWEAAVAAWEMDGTQPNPFEIPNKGMFVALTICRDADLDSIGITYSAARLALAEEDAMRLSDRTIAVLHEQVSPSGLIVAGLELEEQQ